MARPEAIRKPPPGDEERLAWLRLARCENVGPVTFAELLRRFGSAAAALEALPSLAAEGGRRHYRLFSQSAAEAELAAAAKTGARLLLLCEKDYPPLLRHIHAPPPCLYIKGNPACLQKPCIGIVGSRKASALGQSLAKTLAASLGQSGMTAASGLARGIDAAAHWGALETGTAAFLAGGADVIYPPENRALYEAIVEKGAIVSESPPGFQPRGQDFPRRNRLITGVSLGLIVVEAARQSGSLVSARFALEQNREIFAVPGHPLDARAAGPNHLIRSGATLVRNAEDVLEAIAPLLGVQPDAPQSGFAFEETPLERQPHEAWSAGRSCRDAVWAALGASPASIDAIIQATGLNARDVNAALLELDLAGRIDRCGSAHIARRLG